MKRGVDFHSHEVNSDGEMGTPGHQSATGNTSGRGLGT